MLFFIFSSACHPRPRQHLGGRRAGKGLITCPRRSPHGPRRFLLWGGRWYPFHLPLGLLQVLLPGWTRLSTTELPFAGEKRLKKRSPGPAAPQQSCSAPVHCSEIKKKSSTHPHTTWDTGQGTGHGWRHTWGDATAWHGAHRGILEGFVGLSIPCTCPEARR